MEQEEPGSPLWTRSPQACFLSCISSVAGGWPWPSLSFCERRGFRCGSPWRLPESCSAISLGCG